jgi:hypothetical protein
MDVTAREPAQGPSRASHGRGRGRVLRNNTRDARKRLYLFTLGRFQNKRVGRAGVTFSPCWLDALLTASPGIQDGVAWRRSYPHCRHRLGGANWQ